MEHTQFTDLLHNQIQGKNVLFITTKNISYIRNLQEINILKTNAKSCTIIGSNNKNYILRLIKVYFSLLFSKTSSYDVFWIGFAPQLILPIFKFKFPTRNSIIIEDFFISLFDTFCNDRKKVKPNSIIGKLLHFIDKITLSFAHYIVCDTHVHKEYFITEFHSNAQKMHVLYLKADKNIYAPMKITRPEYLKDKYVVLYFGSVLPLQGIDIVLEAMDMLKSHEDIFFFFIGPINSPKLSAAKAISSNIKYIDWLSQEELAKHINYADLCLAGHFNASIEKAKRTIPGKAFIYQAIEKPMVLGDNPANHELFSDNSNAIFVEMGSASALKNAILSAYSNSFPI